MNKPITPNDVAAAVFLTAAVVYVAVTLTLWFRPHWLLGT